VCAYARRPRRTRRSHDCQRASRKLSVHAVVLFVRIMHPTILPRRFAPAASVQSPYLTLSGCVLLSQGGPGVRLEWHRRQRQELRRQRCTARRIGGCDNHCDDIDAQHDRASHGRRGRDVRYARTIKETQAKPASLIPYHQSRLQEISWQDFWRSHAPRGATSSPMPQFGNILPANQNAPFVSRILA
jgi:hypothetical protein